MVPLTVHLAWTAATAVRSPVCLAASSSLLYWASSFSIAFLEVSSHHLAKSSHQSSGLTSRLSGPSPPMGGATPPPGGVSPEPAPGLSWGAGALRSRVFKACSGGGSTPVSRLRPNWLAVSALDRLPLRPGRATPAGSRSGLLPPPPSRVRVRLALPLRLKFGVAPAAPRRGHGVGDRAGQASARPPG
ncbi:MAG: hypothetical protein C4333_05625 [Meiothermus sp.]